MTTFTDARSFKHIIFPPDSSNRVQHYIKRDGVWSGIEKVNQARNQPGTILDCADIQDELDRVFSK